tara:strand:- start:40 stop:243 length:204 start_codon:yes stop_codon:yes gene_type:complete
MARIRYRDYHPNPAMRVGRVFAAIGVISLICRGGLLVTALFPPILKIPVAFLTAQGDLIQSDLISVL